MAVEMALLWFGVLTLATLSIEIQTTYIVHGFGFGFSSNRPKVERSGLPLRISRAYNNQVESAAYIVPILAAAVFMGAATPAIETAAMVVVLARLGFVVMYYSGIHFARVPFFLVSVLALLYMVYALVTSVS
ncbi:MAPEG family protein [Thalassobius sp. MITS945101]|uniref:MAPEG family protein n=1 Tax=Thalassobius sp. MITS945101 TaxID=3096994 RepID=UPI00399B0454